MNGMRRRATRDLQRARVRITALAVVCLAVVMVVGALAVLGIYRRDLVKGADGRLRSTAAEARSIAESTTSVSGVSTDVLVQVIDEQGALVYAGTPLAGDPPLWTPGQRRAPHTVRSPSQGDVRVFSIAFRGGWLVFAESLQQIDHDVTTLRSTLLLTFPLVILALGLVVWFAVGRALRPVAAAVEREEQLVADVSHELRSPIAGIRVLLETQPGDAAQVEQHRLDALATLTRLELISDQLLAANRPNSDVRRSSFRPTDLDEIVQRVVRRLTPRTTCRIDTTQVVAGQILGDEPQLESLVENLLVNAVRHARSEVRIAVHEARGTVELAVEDDGPGIPPEHRELVFERFTRLDEARSRTDGGAGLGLAIVRSVVDAHRGTVTITDGSSGGARFVVEFPATTAADEGIDHGATRSERAVFPSTSGRT